MPVLNGMYECWALPRNPAWDQCKRMAIAGDGLYLLERDVSDTRKIRLMRTTDGETWETVSSYTSTGNIGPVENMNLFYDPYAKLFRLVYSNTNSTICYNDYNLGNGWGEEVIVSQSNRQLFGALGTGKLHLAYEAYIYMGSWNWRLTYRYLDLATRAWSSYLTGPDNLYSYSHPTIALLMYDSSELPIIAHDSKIFRVEGGSLVNEYSGSGNNWPRLCSYPGIVHCTMPYNDAQIYYRRRTSGGWQGSWQLIFDRSSYGLASCRAAEIVCDEDGVVHCLIHGGSASGNDLDRIYYMYRSTSGSWSTPELVWNGDTWRSGESWAASADGRDTGAHSYAQRGGVGFSIPVYRIDVQGSYRMLFYAVDLPIGYSVLWQCSRIVGGDVSA